MSKITELYAFVGTGPDDGILGYGSSLENIKPMITGSITIAKMVYLPTAREIERASGRSFRILKYKFDEEIKADILEAARVV